MVNLSGMHSFISVYRFLFNFFFQIDVKQHKNDKIVLFSVFFSYESNSCHIDQLIINSSIATAILMLTAHLPEVPMCTRINRVGNVAVNRALLAFLMSVKTIPRLSCRMDRSSNTRDFVC